MCAYSFKDNEFDEILNEVDDEMLNTDLGETMLSVVRFATSERQVAAMLAVAQGAIGTADRAGWGSCQGPTSVTTCINLLSK